ncbi:MAG: ferritin-like domain-containing protein, partial [Actinomycetota bacterium]|nr:ferritin-like domain-containing protein [Actinomycetota bacterium]
MSAKAVIEFDLDRYLRNSKKVDLSEIDWDEIPHHELSDGDVMCLHYMMDIEAHTVIYLRDLLATRAAADPQITAFLSCWAYEELWHGEAFSDFLR